MKKKKRMTKHKERIKIKTEILTVSASMSKGVDCTVYMD